MPHEGYLKRNDVDMIVARASLIFTICEGSYIYESRRLGNSTAWAIRRINTPSTF